MENDSRLFDTFDDVVCAVGEMSCLLDKHVEVRVQMPDGRPITGWHLTENADGSVTVVVSDEEA